MRVKFVFVLAMLQCAGLAAMAGAVSAPARPSAKLYVTNSEGDDLTVIDVDTLKVIGSIKVGQRPHGLIASPDRRTLYVSIEGTNELIAVDTREGSVTWRTPVGRTPNQITISRDGNFVFVPLRDDSAVDVVDTKSMKVIDRIKVPNMPHNTYTSFDGRHIYVGSMSGSRITVIDEATRKVLYEIAPGGWVRPIAIKRDESIAYTALSGLHGFAVVDLKERRTTERLELPPLPRGTPRPFLDTYTHGLVLTPDEHELYVTSMPGNAVYVFDSRDLKKLAKIDVGKDPNWLAAMPHGHLVFASNTSDNTVSAIDTRSRKVVATIPVGRAPKRIAVVEAE